MAFVPADGAHHERYAMRRLNPHRHHGKGQDNINDGRRYYNYSWQQHAGGGRRRRRGGEAGAPSAAAEEDGFGEFPPAAATPEIATPQMDNRRKREPQSRIRFAEDTKQSSSPATRPSNDRVLVLGGGARAGDRRHWQHHDSLSASATANIRSASEANNLDFSMITTPGGKIARMVDMDGLVTPSEAVANNASSSSSAARWANGTPFSSILRGVVSSTPSINPRQILTTTPSDKSKTPYGAARESFARERTQRTSGGNDPGGRNDGDESTALAFARSAPLSGYLRKLGENIPTFKRRFFVLKPSTHLYYFLSPNDAEPRGCIDLDTVQNNGAGCEVREVESLPDGAFRFELLFDEEEEDDDDTTASTDTGSRASSRDSSRKRSFQRKSIVLEARTEEIGREWMDRIRSERLSTAKNELDYLRTNLTEMKTISVRWETSACEEAMRADEAERQRDAAISEAKGWEGKFRDLNEAIRLLAKKHYARGGAASSTSSSSEFLAETLAGFDVDDTYLGDISGAFRKIHDDYDLASKKEKEANGRMLELEKRAREAECRAARAESELANVWEDNRLMQGELRKARREKKILVREVRSWHAAAAAEEKNASAHSSRRHGRCDDASEKHSVGQKQQHHHQQHHHHQQQRHNDYFRSTNSLAESSRGGATASGGGGRKQQQYQQHHEPRQQHHDYIRSTNSRAESSRGGTTTSGGGVMPSFPATVPPMKPKRKLLNEEEKRLVIELEEHVMSGLRLSEQFLTLNGIDPSEVGDDLDDSVQASSVQAGSIQASAQASAEESVQASKSSLDKTPERQSKSRPTHPQTLLDLSTSPRPRSSNEMPQHHDANNPLGSLFDENVDESEEIVVFSAEVESTIPDNTVKEIEHSNEVDGVDMSYTAESTQGSDLLNDLWEVDNPVNRNLNEKFREQITPGDTASQRESTINRGHTQLTLTKEENSAKPSLEVASSVLEPSQLKVPNNLNIATTKLECPLKDVGETPLPKPSNSTTGEDGKVYHITFYGKKIGLQFQKVPNETKSAGLLTEAMTADHGPNVEANQTASELRRIASISQHSRARYSDQGGPDAAECLPVAPDDAVLVCGFAGFDSSTGNVRPRIGARLVAFDGMTVEVGQWTFESIRKSIQARSRPLTLSFRNDFLTPKQRAILTKAIEDVKPPPPPQPPPTAHSHGPKRDHSSARGYQHHHGHHHASTIHTASTTSSSLSSHRSQPPKGKYYSSFSEAGSSISSAVAPLMSNLLSSNRSGTGKQQDAFAPDYLRRTSDSLDKMRHHQNFQSGLL